MRSLQCTALLSCLLAAILLAAGCEEQSGQPAARLVKTFTVTASSGSAHPLLTGQVQAHTSVACAFRVSGQIARRLASIGDHVTRGQPLAVLDDTILRNSLQAAQADETAARAASVQADQHDARVRRLLSERAVSRENAEASTRQLKAARAQLDAARAQRASAEEQLGYATLTAEADGLITDRLAESGEVVAAGQPVFRLAVDGDRDAVFDLPDSLLAEAKVGGGMHICLDRRRDRCSRAELYEVSPEADPDTRTYRVKAVIENPAGMDLGATLTGRLDGQDDQLRIPAQALCSVEGRPSVWLVDKEQLTVSARAVEVASYTTDEVVIASGLEVGDSIVTAGVQLLHQGQTVRVQ